MKALAPTVRAELNGPLHPHHVRNQYYGAVDGRYLYYTHINDVAKEYDLEMRIMQQHYPGLLKDLDMIKQASRLAGLAHNWH